ncbi:MAG: hypothetical protein RLZZ290_458 [Pseudomonadota bacterium]|jgi:hypothetical protein
MTPLPKPPRKPPASLKVKPPCRVCRQVRVYLIFAVPLVVMIFLGIRVEFPEDLDMTAVVGYGFAVLFLLQVLRRIYLDYLRKDRDR